MSTLAHTSITTARTASCITTVDGVQHGRFKIILEASRQIVGRRELMIDRTWQTVDLCGFPGGFDADVGVAGGPYDIGRGQQGIG